jgi:hypothetical protein
MNGRHRGARRLRLRHALSQQSFDLCAITVI